MSARRLATAVMALLTADVLLIVVTGSTSLGPGLSPVGALGFVGRLALLAAALWARVRVLPPRERRLAGAWTALLLLALPALAQLHLAGARLSGDGIMYYVYVRSLVKDGDVDFTNEYAHYGRLDREDLRVPTETGLRRSIFAIGPGLMWTPFFVAGEAVARAQAALGGTVDLSGYGPSHVNAVAFGNFAYGFLAVLLVHALLRRHFPPGVAFAAALLMWAATFLHWYMVHQPTMSHAVSACAAALVLWLWDRSREDRSTAGFALLGLALGLAMCVRWQNAVFGLLPAFDLARRAGREHPARLLAGAAALALGIVLGALPQMLAWNAIYGAWLLPYPPHGADFVRLGHPFLLQTLFSSRHGLLSWTPVLWAGFLGFIPLWRRRPMLAGPLLVPLLVMTYVNACSGDWWAGGSFSNRRFDGLLPALACGLAAMIDALRSWLRQRPRTVLALAVAPFAVWHTTLAVQASRGELPARDTVAFPRLAGGSARVVAEMVGSPPTWPASWLFAWRHDRPPAQYDRLVGQYLFYRQNNLRGLIPLGVAGDEVLLGEGWGDRTEKGGVAARVLLGRARLFAPLDAAEDLDVLWRVAADGPPTEIVVQVNGKTAGRLAADGGWRERRQRIPAAFWRRELNDVVLDPDGGRALVASVQVLRVHALPGDERGARDR